MAVFVRLYQTMKIVFHEFWQRWIFYVIKRIKVFQLRMMTFPVSEDSPLNYSLIRYDAICQTKVTSVQDNS